MKKSHWVLVCDLYLAIVIKFAVIFLEARVVVGGGGFGAYLFKNIFKIDGKNRYYRMYPEG